MSRTLQHLARRAITRAAIVVVGLVLSPRLAAAQWVDNPGDLEMRLGSEVQFANREFRSDITLVGVQSQSLRQTLGATYVPLEGLSIEAGATWQLDSYTGAEMTGGVPLRHGANDDGSWHGNFGDFNGAVRYVVYDRALVITPYLRTKLPLTDYPRQGYAATGTGLKELGGGVDIGRVGVVSNRVLVSGGYSYTFVEKEAAGGMDTEQYRPSYSQVQLQVGVILRDDLVVGGGATYLHTHQGFDLDDYGPLYFSDRNNGLVLWHDPVSKRIFLALSAYANYNITETLSGQLMFSIIPWGDNVTDAKLIGIQLGWTLPTRS
jgi:hypothetical protein